MKYKTSEHGNLKKLKFDRIVDSDKYVDFVKFIRQKNKNSQIIIKPSDSKLLMNYGRELRKFIDH